MFCLKSLYYQHSTICKQRTIAKLKDGVIIFLLWASHYVVATLLTIICLCSFFLASVIRREFRRVDRTSNILNLFYLIIGTVIYLVFYWKFFIKNLLMRNEEEYVSFFSNRNKKLLKIILPIFELIMLFTSQIYRI